jgi:glycosyltransferase involved in cell wall biosynthesis
VARRWIVLRERKHQRWGGDLRRHYVFSALAARPDATDVSGWSRDDLRGAVSAQRGRWFRSRPFVVAATPLAPDTLRVLDGAAVPFAVDYHDDAIRQNEVLGVIPDETWLAAAREKKRLNLDAFRWHVVPSNDLAELAGLDPERTIVAGNGTDPGVIVPIPWPTDPAIGMISGAAPRRGIEQVIEAARLVRSDVPDLRLLLWLAATGSASAEYLEDLRTRVRHETWIEIASAPYRVIGPELGRAMIQCIPNPPAEYWDAVSPIKLFDAMATSRPVVVTPRRAMREVVELHEAGLVTEGDRPEDLAAAVSRLLGDQALARRLGENGRRAAEGSYAWPSIAQHLADRLVALSTAR